MKRHIAILVAIAMIVTMMPVSAFADKVINPTLGDPVCSIGNTPYTSVEAAIADVKRGDTITLLANVENLEIDAKDKIFMLDLNGKTVGAVNVKDTGLTVTDAGGVVIQNGNIIGDRSTATLLVINGSVVMNNVFVTNGNTSAGYAVGNAGGTLKIFSGKFKASAYDGSAVINTTKGAKTSVDVGSFAGTDNDGTGYDWVVTVDSTPDVVLDGVKYSDASRAMQDVKSGSNMVLQNNIPWLTVDAAADFTLDLNGKTIGNEIDSSALYVDTENEVKIINGSIVANEPDWGALWIISGKVILEDVAVTSLNDSQPAVLNAGGTLEVISGTFTTASAYEPAVSTGESAVTKIGSCTVTDPAAWESAASFTATVATEPEVTLDGVKYASYTRALQDAKSGSEIVLQKSLSAIAVDSGDIELVLNLNGNTVNSIKVDTQGSVKIKNGNVICRSAKNGAVHIVSGDVTLEDVSIKCSSSTLAAIYNQAGTLEILSVELIGANSVVQPITTRDGATTTFGEYTVTNADLSSWFTAVDLSGKTITLESDSYTYNGESKTPAVTIEGVSSEFYDIAYSDNLNAGTAKVVISGKYTDAVVTKEFAIAPIQLTDVTLSKTSYTYNGSARKPTVTVKAGEKILAASNYDVTYSSGRPNAGTYKVTVTGKRNYAGTITKTFKINPAKITKATLSANTYTYNGKAKKPTVTVKAGTLKPATKISADTKNIDLTYSSGRKNVGTYKVTIKGKGNYTGTITKSFRINPKGVAISSLKSGKKALTVTWKKPAANYRNQLTGYQIRYSTSSNMSIAKVVKVTSKTATTKTIKNLKANKKYYVQIRTYRVKNGVNYTSAWSAKKSIKTK